MTSKEKKHDAKNLKSDNFSQKSLWLVKIPTFVAKSWEHAENDEEIGLFTVESAPAPPLKSVGSSKTLRSVGTATSSAKKAKISKIKLHVKEGGESIPLSYTLDELHSSEDSNKTVIAFSLDSESDQYSLNGNLTRKFVMKGSDSSEMKEYNKQLKSCRVTSTATEISGEQVRSYRRDQICGEFTIDPAPERRRKTEGVLDEHEIKGKILEIFKQDERQDWKSIWEYCRNCPGADEKAVKALLRELADLHKSGEFRNFFELKREYKVRAL